MNNETEMVLLLWEKVKEYIQPNRRDDVAVQILNTIVGSLDDVDIDALYGEDQNLDVAIDALREPEIETTVEEDFEDDWD